MSRERSWASGFTLVEIMIALAILSIGLLSLYTAQGNSLRASGRAEDIQTASLLARQLMAQKMLEIEQGMSKGQLPEDKEVETGEFDPPFDRYRWEYSVRQVTIPLSGGTVDGTEPGGNTAENQAQQGSPQPGKGAEMAPESAQRSIAQIVTKKIKEAVREINVKVIWEDLGEEQSIKVTTHVAKL